MSEDFKHMMKGIGYFLLAGLILLVFAGGVMYLFRLDDRDSQSTKVFSPA